MSLKENLLSLNFVVDNVYLDKYCELIESNRNTKREKFKTQKHHIIPRCYYKYNKLNVDNSKDNLINLLYKDHILAHIYLSMCFSVDWLMYVNNISIYFMLNKYNIEGIIDELSLLEDFQLKYENNKKLNYKFNPMFNEQLKAHHDEIMKSEEVRNKISSTVKKNIKEGKFFTEEHKRKLSESARGRVYVHKDGVYTSIKLGQLEEYLSDGWIQGGRPLSKEHKEALINSHLGKKYSLELRQKLSESHKGQVPKNKGVPCSKEVKERLSKIFSGSRWMNNGLIQKQVFKENIEEYLSKGFVFGRLKQKGSDVSEKVNNNKNRL